MPKPFEGLKETLIACNHAITNDGPKNEETALALAFATDTANRLNSLADYLRNVLWESPGNFTKPGTVFEDLSALAFALNRLETAVFALGGEE